MPPTKRLRPVRRKGAPAIETRDSPAPAAPEGTSFETAMSTAEAYRGQPAKRFVADLAQRIALAGDLAERLETALHEAVANAIIHGNLGLSSPRHDDLDRCVAQEAVIDRLLERPDLSRRAITITARWTANEIELTVQDEGHGYIDPPEAAAAQGSGLFIIRAIADRVTTGDDGRRLAMRFAR
jgi:anti-sigma regulatory factor (Ser/Thr protein kinase)